LTGGWRHDDRGNRSGGGIGSKGITGVSSFLCN
jgi:hypothetical protein